MAQKEDKMLSCADCGRKFTWTASEQAFFEKKGFKEIPKRCPDCRRFRRDGKLEEIKCADCGKSGTFSFPAEKGVTYLCEECAKKRAGQDQA